MVRLSGSGEAGRRWTPRGSVMSTIADGRAAEGVLGVLAGLRVVPVVVAEQPDQAAPLATALVRGGLPCAEVTFRTAAAEAVLREMAQNPDVLVGAGTVIRPEQVDRAVNAGARFVVTPGFNARVVAACQELGVLVIPGIATPTEILAALDAGLDTVKFFPAESLGGVTSLKAMSAPFGGVRFMPTGGITAASMSSYLSVPSVVAVGGSWMVAPGLLQDGRYDEVSRLAAQAVELATRA
jgi:2-dehydro-3-deoxyphosphogluconate aldolase/(4S)-4-hydroxy-2-oxoglutarate aldolase